MVIELTRKKVFIFISLLVVLVAVPLTVYLSQRQQDTRSRAAEVPDSTVVATINGESITKGQVREVALEQYDPSAVDSQALKDALATLIERKILDKEGERLGLSPEPAELANALTEGLEDSEGYYEVLKNKVILSEVHSRLAVTIDFWSPTEEDLSSLTAEEKALAETQLIDGTKALAETEAALKTQDDVLQIGEDIVAKYPSLRDVWGVNGYILTTLEEDEKSIVSAPQLFEYADSPLDQAVRDQLFSMNEGEVKTVKGVSTNKGGVVLKLVRKGNDSGAGSYQQWFDQKKAQMVTEVPNVL